MDGKYREIVTANPNEHLQRVHEEPEASTSSKVVQAEPE
jgi:hypothetical protein